QTLTVSPWVNSGSSRFAASAATCSASSCSIILLIFDPFDLFVGATLFGSFDPVARSWLVTEGQSSWSCRAPVRNAGHANGRLIGENEGRVQCFGPRKPADSVKTSW